MSRTNKILWGEGLFLRPQHFQLQDQYHESQLSEIARTISPYYWGIKTIKFDRGALMNGQLRITELTAIFPDGELFDAPNIDDLPDSLNLTNLKNGSDGSLIYLAIAPIKAHGENSVEKNAKTGQIVRYRRDHQTKTDLYTQALEAEVTILRSWVRLMNEQESRDQFISLPIAKIHQSATGGFEIDDTYIPPSTSIASSSVLHQMLRGQLDMLQAKVNALYGHHREPSKNIIEFRSGDIASFWLLHTASHHYASMLHLYQNPRLHPERMFQQMLAMAGALMTFSKSHQLSDLPAYQHEHPTSCFLKIDHIIRELLETVISSRYFAISLSETKPSFWKGRLDSNKIDADTVFYLSVTSTMPATELVEAIPLRSKIGAPDDVEKFVLSAMPGVRLTYAPQVPAAVPVRPGHFYFAIENKGALYERLLKSQSISIYISNNIPDIKLELIAVTS